MPQTGKIRRVQQLYARGEITCEELTRRYLDSVERDNGTLNAYVTVTPDTALDAARRVDAKLRAGETLRPLEGIPMTLKDNISTRGIPTTCCSRILEGYTPIYDATVWELLQRENAVLLGKTNMDEFAMGSSCETSCFGGAKIPLTPAMWRAAPRAAWPPRSAAALRCTGSARIPAAPSASRRVSAAWSGSSPPTARFPATA